MIELPPGHIHLWLARDAGALDAGLAARYASLLNVEERARWQRFMHAADRQRFLLTRALARTVLAQYAGEADPVQLVFVANVHGKPALAASSAISFNLSHTKGLVALAVTSRDEIGVDVETVTRRCAALELAARYFSAAENQQLLALPAERQRELFFRLWTLKEAYVKAKGLGLRISLASFSFDLAGDRLAISIADKSADEEGRWYFQCLEYADDFRIALALRSPQAREVEVRIREGLPLCVQKDQVTIPEKFDRHSGFIR